MSNTKAIDKYHMLEESEQIIRSWNERLSVYETHYISKSVFTFVFNIYKRIWCYLINNVLFRDVPECTCYTR